VAAGLNRGLSMSCGRTLRFGRVDGRIRASLKTGGQHMRIGIDFGTSYSAAGAVVDGQVQLVRFGDDLQFRTAVFFPTKLPDLAQFELTPELAARVDRLVESGRRDQAQQAARLQGLRDAAMRLPEPQRSAQLALVPTFRAQTDIQLRRAANATVRREWGAEQTREAMAARIDVGDALYGDAAIQAFMDEGGGRLLVSPKSMLGYNLDGPVRDDLLRITSFILRHIRETASAQFGTEVRSVVMGRPVEFRSSRGEEGGLLALQTIRDAAIAAGFEHVEFLEEPAAAAYGYHGRLTEQRRVLIVDIGGGTTDMALADLGGDARLPAVHRSWGTPVGGTDVDRELTLRGVMPLFGKYHTNTPVHFYAHAASVWDVIAQRDFRQASFDRIDPPYGPRLQALQQPGHTVRLNRSVERAKIGLSDGVDATVPLEYIEPALQQPLTGQTLTDAADPFVRALRSLMQTAKTDIAEHAPDTIYLTGGMSRSPYVPVEVRAMFPGIEVVAGDASLGVVTGLARAAAAQPTTGG